MQQILRTIPRVAFFLAGVAAGAITSSRRMRAAVDPPVLDELKRSLEALKKRLADQEAKQIQRLTIIEDRLNDQSSELSRHADLLANIPSTTQIVSAMEQLLEKTMASLDDRLSTQAHSIEVLKTTVVQTDSLLEQILESLDSLQSDSDPDETDDPVSIGRSAL